MERTAVKIPWPDWQLVEQVGRGQFGTVYKISCTKFGITEYAAMKVISIPSDPQMIENDYSCGYDKDSVASKYKSYLDDVLKEYQLMMKVKGNAGIVRCDDISVFAHEDGIGWDVYIRMEYLTPIMRVLSDISNEESIVQLGIFMCEALDECERNNILHRDIKPSNILMSSRGEFKLGDFGVSRTLESENTYGTKGIGTYDYMAPEVYNGGKYGKEADIYSLGMVMYWLLNGRTYPFLTKGKAPTAQEIIIARQKRFSGDKLPRPIHGNTALVSVVLKACEFDPKNRYKTAKEMLDDLVNIKYGSTVNPNVITAQKEEPVKDGFIHNTNRKDTNNAWNDAQETVGNEYSNNRKAINGSETIGKANFSSVKKTSPSEDASVKQTKEKIPKKATRKINALVLENFDVGGSEETFTIEPSIQSDNNISWNDTQETVGKDYSRKRESIYDSKTVGKTYDYQHKSNSQIGNIKNTVSKDDLKYSKSAQVEQASVVEKMIKAEKKAKTTKITIVITIIVALIVLLIVFEKVIFPTMDLNRALRLLDAGDYETASSILAKIDNSELVASSKYDKAMALIDSGNYEAAYILLNGLNYKDSNEKLDSIRPQYNQNIINRAQVGDNVFFGSYEQDNNLANGKEDIEWIVLAREDEKVLLISKYALDFQPYNEIYSDITWENCTLRVFLNNTFLNEAFCAEEENIILRTKVTADYNPDYLRSPGNDTEDKVFLLSVREAKKYFGTDIGYQCQFTDYCFNGRDKNRSEYDYYDEYEGTCFWWLRTPGCWWDDAAVVYDDVETIGTRVDFPNGGVRPALWLDLNT